MNIYDVSREANVSAATVSRVINGSSKVSPATRKKVLDVIHKSGYIPNAFAQGLSHDTMRTVGILCVDPSDPNACGNFSMGIGYVQRELRGFDYDTVIYCVGYDMEDKASCLQTMCDRRVDAIVVLGSFFVEGRPGKECLYHQGLLSRYRFFWSMATLMRPTYTPSAAVTARARFRR